ncbi:MAG: RNA pseudouridine synthase [Candidatus Sungbacteria bacterium]|nr:RNA pseudouridine synthase [Candidatus Sungbacteria bacterium]
MEPVIIYEGENFVVINKPAGLAVHAGGSIKTEEALTAWLVARFPEIKNVGDLPAEALLVRRSLGEAGAKAGEPYRPGIVHRLDKETSGVMVIARNQESFEILKQLFKTRQVEKKYIALVHGVITEKSGVINLPVGALKGNGVKRTTREKYGREMKDAVTEFQVLERFSNATLVEVMPKTGRMHQIRVHFAALHHPVVGDRLYGKKEVKSGELGRQFLHAGSLSFSYPGGRRFVFEASLPEDLKSFLASLRKDR